MCVWTTIGRFAIGTLLYYACVAKEERRYALFVMSLQRSTLTSWMKVNDLQLLDSELLKNLTKLKRMSPEELERVGATFTTVKTDCALPVHFRLHINAKANCLFNCYSHRLSWSGWAYSRWFSNCGNQRNSAAVPLNGRGLQTKQTNTWAILYAVL